MFQHLQLVKPLAIIDLETTGLDATRDRIIELAIVKHTLDGQVLSAVQRLDPGIPIPPAATTIHGIRDTDVAGHPSFGVVVAPLVDFLAGCDIAGYGIKRFDLPFLQAECARVGRELSLDGRAIIDVLQIFHHHEPRDLAAAVRRYCGRENIAAHGALADAAATAAVLDGMLACYSDLPRNLGDLDASFRIPDAIDRDGRFVRDGEHIVFAFGRHRDRPLAAVARGDPAYLRWMLSAGFAADTTRLVREALRQVGLGVSTQVPCRRPIGTTSTFAGPPGFLAIASHIANGGVPECRIGDISS